MWDDCPDAMVFILLYYQIHLFIYNLINIVILDHTPAQNHSFVFNVDLKKKSSFIFLNRIIV